MSKVICDVCGTTYPETASACPICGSAKNTTAQTAAGAQQEQEMSYTYVKGGRFSKSNVRKRNNSQELRRAPAEDDDDRGGSNKGLVIVIITLVLAIVVVLAYMGIRYIFPKDPQPSDPPRDTSGQTDPNGPTDPVNPGVPCTALELDKKTVEFTMAGSAHMLSVTADPADTTDPITFASADERIATVSKSGLITAVAGGETTITVTCGNITAECKVICSFGTPIGPTDPTRPDVVIPDGFVLKLNREDFTLSKESESWTLYKETDGVKASDITWVSDAPEIATVVDGKVTGVDYGDATIHATLGDQTVSCIVRVRFHASEVDPDRLKISHTDVTLKEGESFRLTLTTEEGVKVDVEWEVSEEGYVTINGSSITAAASTQEIDGKCVIVSATHEEKTYECVIRVWPKEEEKAE